MITERNTAHQGCRITRDLEKSSSFWTASSPVDLHSRGRFGVQHGISAPLPMGGGLLCDSLRWRARTNPKRLPSMITEGSTAHIAVKISVIMETVQPGRTEFRDHDGRAPGTAGFPMITGQRRPG